MYPRKGDPIPDRKLTVEDLCAVLGLGDPEGFLHDLQHILTDVYRANVDRYDETLGDDKITFGSLVYRNSWFQLERDLPVSHPDVRVDRPNGSLTIHTPGPGLKVYKGGSGPTFEIEEYDPESGSVTKQRTVELNERQLTLFNPDSTHFAGNIDAGLAAPVWFVVHYGNPVDGFLGMGIGAPRQSSIEDPQWLFTFLLPDLCADRGCGEDPNAAGGVSVAPSPLLPSGPSYDQMPEPTIRIEPISVDDE